MQRWFGRLPRRPEVKSFNCSRDLCSLKGVCRKWCFQQQHRVGGVQLEESDMTCKATCSSSCTSRAARRDSVVAGGDRTATAAAGFKDRGSIATGLSPHAGQWRVNGQGYGRAPDHGLSSSMAPKRFTTSVPC